MMRRTTAGAGAVGMSLLLCLCALAVTVHAAAPISAASQLSDADKARLDEVIVKRREREARRPVARHPMSSADMINAHLAKDGKKTVPMPTGELPRPATSDDKYEVRLMLHSAPNKEAPPLNHNNRVRAGTPNFTTIARWPDGTHVRFVVDWEDAEHRSGVPADDIRRCFDDAAVEWQSIGPRVPRIDVMPRVDRDGDQFQPWEGLPSAFQERRVRNGVNEFKIYEHNTTYIEDNHALGGVMLWIDKSTRTIVEVDGFIALHDNDKVPVRWHVGNHHHHPKSGHHLRRIISALLGHALGLGHSPHTAHAMAGISPPGTPMQLMQGDRDGILSLYH